MLESIFDERTKQINDYLEEMIMREITSTYTTTSSANIDMNEPLTVEKLLELEKQLKPYVDMRKKLYEYSIPTYKLTIDQDEDMTNYKMLAMYGMPVLKPTKTIITKVQKRKHRQKRINKKWLKKYGYIEIKKEVPDFGLISLIKS